MMEITTESFEIVCDTCGEKITIWRDDLDADVSSYDHGENGMGEEIMRRMREMGFDQRIELIGVPGAFIAHASVEEQTRDNLMDAESVCMRTLKALGKEIM